MNEFKYCIAALFVLATSQSVSAQDRLVEFDVPPYIAATELQSPIGERIIEILVPVSCFVDESDANKQPQQLLVKAQLQNQRIKIHDYAPKTTAASQLDGGTKIKSSVEDTGALGLGINTDLSSFAKGNLGVDRGTKQLFASEFTARPHLQTVIASGTINRGQGVYFKWRRTADQIIEGNKTCRIQLQTPLRWRSGILNLSISTQSGSKRSRSNQEFALPFYVAGDHEAKEMASSLARLETQLQESAPQRRAPPPSLSMLIHQVAANLEFDSPTSFGNDWLPAFLQGKENAYLDRTISGLPMEVRRLAVRYQRLRRGFLELNQT